MNLSQLLDDFAAKGVVFSVERGRLQCHVPKGVPSAQIADVVARNKNEIIRILSAARPAVRAVHAEQGSVTGPAPLTPIQHWFFAQELSNAQHWNQCILLALTRTTSLAEIEAVFGALIKHHDALRFRYRSEGPGGLWLQEGTAPEGPVPVACVDLGGLEQACSEAQKSLSLTEGPLLRVILFNGDNEQRLFITIHHLVVDGFSWRVFLEDLSTALAQIARGGPISLPRKSTSYRYWAERLMGYATSDAIVRDAAFWSSRPWHAPKPVPRDFTGTGDSANTVKWEETVSVSFSAEVTRRLLQEANAAYRSRTDELLIAAFAEAYRQWSGHAELLVGLEGHGREPFQDDLDLSRTVGWFTTLYPVVLNTGQPGDPAGLIRQTKETLRQIPNKGLSFGLLRYIARNPALDEVPQPEIIFNYLGQFVSPDASDAPLRACQGATGRLRSEAGRRAQLIAIDAIVSHGQLQVAFSFSTRIHRRESIVDFSEEFRSALLAISRHCLSTPPGASTPSDFPLLSVTQQQIGELEARFGALEDLWPLTSTQAGFLYASLAASDKPYVEQVVVEVGLPYEPAQLERAWRLLQERHPVLRSVVQFLGNTPALVVPRKGSPERQFSCADWRSRPARQKDRESVGAQASTLRLNGFDLLAVRASRMDVILLEDSRYSVIWTFHHLVLDGWSNAKVVGEWLALAHGAAPSTLPAAGSFGTYLSWLRAQDRPAAIAYWMEYLGSVREPCSIGTKVRRTERLEKQTRKLTEAFTTDVSQTLRELARKHSASLNAVVQVAWAIVLHRYSGADRVCFGKTVSGRSAQLKDSDLIVGTLVNTVPVCIDLGEAEDFWQLVEEVQKREARSHEYEYLSAAEIQNGLGYRSDTQLYESVLVFENYPIAKQGSADVELVSVGGGESPYLLTLLFAPGESFSTDLIFDESRIANASARQITAQLRQVITRVAEGSHRLSEIARTLPASERPAINEFVPSGLHALTPAANELEAQILQIWKQTLQMQDLGVENNFFEIGGHSLVAVELIASMNLASLVCSVRDLTEAPSVRRLAERICARRSTEAAPAILASRAPLLPIQREAIESSSPTDRNANPGVPCLFELDPDLDEVALIQALDAWYSQDIFRLRFFREQGQWMQGPEVPVSYACAPIRKIALDPEQELVRQLVTICLEMEQSLDVMTGPTLQLALLTLGGRPLYLLWSIDHLVSDVITGNLLLTRLRLLYRQVSRGQRLSVPKDHTLCVWAKHLAAQARAPAILQELGFWARHFDVEASLVAEQSPGASAQVAVDQVTTQWAEDVAGTSLDRFLKEHRLSFEDLCLGLLLWAHASCFTQSRVLMRMICSGRDEVCDEADLTSGAGWFSMRYPALLTLPETREPVGFVLDIAAQHARYRANRKNYGILRFLNAQTAGQLSGVEAWSKSIPFNCWGEIAGHREGADILSCTASNEVMSEYLRHKRLARAEKRFDSGSDPSRGALFFLIRGKLCVQYSFNGARTDPAQVQQLLSRIISGWTELLNESSREVYRRQVGISAGGQLQSQTLN